MNNRQSFDAFVETAFDAFTAFATDERSRVSIDNVFAAARKADPVLSTGSRRPVCERYLPALLLADYGDAKLNRMMACFSNIERHIRWQPRPVSNATAEQELRGQSCQRHDYRTGRHCRRRVNHDRGIISGAKRALSRS